MNEFIISYALSMVQRTGEIALKHGGDEIETMVEALQKKVALYFEALSSVRSISVLKPEGVFYLFPKMEHMNDFFTFALTPLKENRVSVASGIAFGNGGEGSIWIYCTTAHSILEIAMDRLCRFMENSG